MNALKIIGNQTVAGVEFTGIEGGFGEGKRAMLVKEIADIHQKEVKHINQRINENRSRFKNGVDIIDLLGVGLTDPEIKAYGFSQQAINSYRGQNGNIYILSERGYAKLLKILEDDKAWELYDKLVDGYFNMKSTIATKGKSLIFSDIELEIKRMNAEARLINAKVRQAKFILQANGGKILSPQSKELLNINTIETLIDKPIGYRPEIGKTYSASDLANEFGISSQKIGRLANAHNIKTDEYGIQVLDKARHSDKQVPSFRYNEKGRQKLKEIIQGL